MDNDINEDYDNGEDGGDFADILDIPEIQQDDSVDNTKPELRALRRQHPECKIDYIDSISSKLIMKSVPGGGIGETFDENHRSYPYVTNYEKTRIIGLRSNQLSLGSKPFIIVPKHVTDVREIARLEFDQKRLPMIIKRPMPNGTAEYWRLSDLIIL